MKDILHAEHEAWLTICKLLKESGAVTAADLSSSVTKTDTAGQRLLNAIRHWGDLKAAL